MIAIKQIGIAGWVIVAIAFSTCSQAQKKDSIPQPLGFVNDFENIFSASEERFLDSTIGAFERSTTIQIALITIDTSMTSRGNFDNYVFRIAKIWGVGQKEKNNGIAIGISKGYRMMRIENRYGIEKVLSYEETKNTIDSYFIPDFKQGRYFEGTVKGLQAIIAKLK